MSRLISRRAVLNFAVPHLPFLCMALIIDSTDRKQVGEETELDAARFLEFITCKPGVCQLHCMEGKAREKHKPETRGNKLLFFFPVDVGFEGSTEDRTKYAHRYTMVRILSSEF